MLADIKLDSSFSVGHFANMMGNDDAKNPVEKGGGIIFERY